MEAFPVNTPFRKKYITKGNGWFLSVIVAWHGGCEIKIIAPRIKAWPQRVSPRYNPGSSGHVELESEIQMKSITLP